MKADEFRDEIKKLHDWVTYGCSNHGCAFHIPDGKPRMGTNSTCRCTPQAFSEQLLDLAVRLGEHGKYRRFDK